MANPGLRQHRYDSFAVADGAQPKSDADDRNSVLPREAVADGAHPKSDEADN